MRPGYVASGGVSKFTRAWPDNTFQAIVKQAYDSALDQLEIKVPVETETASLAFIKRMAPIKIEHEDSVTYLHSYGQDSPWFAAASNEKLLANRDPERAYTYATPRGHDMYSGRETEWIDISGRKAEIHAFTVCRFGSEEFLPHTHFVQAQIEYEEVDTLFLTRLTGADPNQACVDWIAMEVNPSFRRNSKLKPTDVYFIPA